MLLLLLLLLLLMLLLLLLLLLLQGLVHPPSIRQTATAHRY
jgi:hypothetical protein